MDKTFKFDKTELKTFPERNHFKTPLRDKLQDEEQCIIDNLWNLSTTQQANPKKVACINALVSYFISGKHSKKKPFLCYVLYTGPKAGVYLKWEEMALLIEEIKLFPRYGTPLYKGFYDIGEAIDSVIKNCGEEVIISPKVLKYQDYLKHLENFEDQEFLRDIDELPAKGKLQTIEKNETGGLRPFSTQTFAETLRQQAPQKRKELLVLGKPKNQEILSSSSNLPSIPSNQPEEVTLNTFILLQECLAQIANNQILHPGISTTWEFTYNIFKICLSHYEDCPENQEGDCLCKLDSAVRKANLLIPNFKPFKFRNYPITISNLLKYGLVNSINIPPLHDFTPFLPSLLAETLEMVTPEFPKKIAVKINSLYPDFEKKIPAYHLAEIFFKGIDDEYEEFCGENSGPRTIKFDEPWNNQLDLVRAKIIADDFGWSRTRFSTKNLLRENHQGKIYCDSTIAARFFFPFDIEHSKPKLVYSYRRQRQNSQEDRPVFHSRPSSSGSSK